MNDFDGSDDYEEGKEENVSDLESAYTEESNFLEEPSDSDITEETQEDFIKEDDSGEII